jgi:hypothetical protein
MGLLFWTFLCFSRVATFDMGSRTETRSGRYQSRRCQGRCSQSADCLLCLPVDSGLDTFALRREAERLVSKLRIIDASMTKTAGHAMSATRSYKANIRPRRLSKV